MADHEYIKALAQAGVFYIPLSFSYSAAVDKSLWLIGRDLTGASFKAQARKNRGVGSPIFTLAAVIASNELKTWQELVDDGIISYVPNGAGVSESVRVTGISLTSTQADVAAAFDAANPAAGGVAEMDWELVATVGGMPSTVCAGTLKITPGVIS